MKTIKERLFQAGGVLDPLRYQDIGGMRSMDNVFTNRMNSSMKKEDYARAAQDREQNRAKIAASVAERAKRAELYKKFIGGQGVAPATTQDSINVRNESRRYEDALRKSGYSESTTPFPALGLGRAYDEISNKKGITQVIRNGQRRAEVLDPQQYGWKEGDNYFKQYDEANGVVNLDISPNSRHPRIAPTAHKRFMGMDGVVKNDGVYVPSYANMNIKSVDRPMQKPIVAPTRGITPTKRPLPIGDSARVYTTTAPPRPDTTRLAPPTKNQGLLYRETTGRTTQDNTRVGADFNTRANFKSSGRFMPEMMKK